MCLNEQSYEKLLDTNYPHPRTLKYEGRNTFEAVCDFSTRDQFLESCSKELYVHLKPKTFKNLDEMATEADLFSEAHSCIFSCVNKRQRDSKYKPESKPSRKPEIKCGIRGKMHLTIRCYKNPDRKRGYGAEIGANASGSKGGNTDYGGNEQGTRF